MVAEWELSNNCKFLASYLPLYGLCVYTYVTEFAKRGLIHASNFSNLRMCNSASVGPIALTFGGKPFLSLY